MSICICVYVCVCVTGGGLLEFSQLSSKEAIVTVKTKRKLYTTYKFTFKLKNGGIFLSLQNDKEEFFSKQDFNNIPNYFFFLSKSH